MNTTQTTLANDPDDRSTTTNNTHTNPRESVKHTTLAPPEDRGGDGCCPWCLASPETFVHHDDGTVRCGHCDAAIPVGAGWYERGEKIIV